MKEGIHPQYEKVTIKCACGAEFEPGLCFPWALSLADAGDSVVRWLVWLYPAYVLLSGLLAWQCYGRRSVLTWIVLTLLVLSHAGMYTLTFMPIG